VETAGNKRIATISNSTSGGRRAPSPPPPRNPATSDNVSYVAFPTGGRGSGKG
jgi:hypothetical protein